MLKIHYYKESDSQYEKQVSSILGSDYRFSTGKELPTDTEVLLLGYPS
ncbi:MAG: hypothetical protein P9L91_09975 [Candidatus Zophobacter franzmannii]|nr:hypothetical protein [Candidatus Zophobacter franzmannii]